MGALSHLPNISKVNESKLILVKLDPCDHQTAGGVAFQPPIKDGEGQKHHDHCGTQHDQSL